MQCLLAFFLWGLGDSDPDSFLSQPNTYFFNFDDQKWTPGPPMMYSTAFHGCALLKSHDRSIVVVAGGVVHGPDKGERNTLAVQFLDLENTDEWFSGKD